MRYALILTFVMFVTGCDPTLVRLSEPTFTEGCYMSNVGAKLGYMNQEGSGTMYKVKCSKHLPRHYCYEVNNQASGVKAKAGDCD